MELQEWGLKSRGKLLLEFGSSPEGALFFRCSHFFWRICLYEKRGSVGEEVPKRGASFRRSTLIFALAPGDGDDDDGDDHQPKNGPPLWPTFVLVQ